MKPRAQPRRPRTKHVRHAAILDLRPAAKAASARATQAHRKRQLATTRFERAFALEESDLNAARAGYRAALDTYAGHLETTINLGRLLHLNGELEAAESVYLTAEHGSALLSFNIALLLEDLQRDEQAVVAYLQALALEPTLHEAHYHLSILHERRQRPHEALKHLLAFRRLTPK